MATAMRITTVSIDNLWGGGDIIGTWWRRTSATAGRGWRHLLAVGGLVTSATTHSGRILGFGRRARLRGRIGTGFVGTVAWAVRRRSSLLRPSTIMRAPSWLLGGEGQ